MKYVAYYRVSTQRQSLGLDAQRNTVLDYIKMNGGELIEEYQEKESGKKKFRPQLILAIESAKKNNARLIIAKLDRLSRDVEFTFSLKNNGVDFIACDMPDCNTLTIGLYATFAQNERERISTRTKDALAVKKQQGVKLGAPNATFTDEQRAAAAAAKTERAIYNENNRRAISAIKDKLEICRLKGVSWNLSNIAKELNESGYKTSRGADFTAKAVSRLIIERL